MNNFPTTKCRAELDQTVEFPVWHTLTGDDVLARLESSNQGLDSQEVARRQERFGRNSLPAQEPPTLLKVFLHQFKSPLIYVLLMAGFMSLVIGDIKDSAFIFAVVFLNAGIGTYQEYKAELSAAALQSLLKIVARVRRSGVESQIEAEGLVPGDIVLLESGQKIPADLRWLQVNGLSVDESFLTGESLPVQKNVTTLGENAQVSERSNMGYAGSTVVSGRGTGVVVATGFQTEVGKIARTVTTEEASKPPLVIRMERFARQVSFVVLAAAILLAAVVLAKGMEPFDVVFLVVALAVSAIPEGLPVAMTVALSIATNRMAKRNVIVRKLAAVEGLGSCTYIASDKTGTLTVNQQTLKAVWLPGVGRYRVTGEGYLPDGEITAEEGRPVAALEMEQLTELARAGVLCNEANLIHDVSQDEWMPYGDSIDVALLVFAHKLGLDPKVVRHQVTPSGEIPFESERRYAAQFYQENGRYYVALKGAVEAVLPFCRNVAGYQNGGFDPQSIDAAALELAASGFRILAVAHGVLEAEPDEGMFRGKDMPTLTLLGLVGFIDPIRPEAKEAVRKCLQAGVKVAMVTGDHPATALAIARQLGLTGVASKEIVTGRELEEAGEPGSPEFIELVKSTRVFSRVAPLQKLHIVEALRELGEFIAVTGDGVNDAPALKIAHIGVAMGSGTDVAKDTASIIITDDNFASVVAGIEEGRFAYDNVRKVTYLLISTGFAELVLFALALFFGMPLPLFAVQLLWLNLVTNGIQDVALAFEGGEPGAMNRPRHPNEGIFNRLMVQQTLVTGLTMAMVAFGLWYWLLSHGLEEHMARNMVFMLMVLLENFHVFNCRSERVSAFKVPISRNYFLVGGVVVAQGIHVLALQIPFMQSVLKAELPDLTSWMALLLLAATVLVASEVFKLVRARF
jgi:magnesium-transporting ATPase (P-type)